MSYRSSDLSSQRECLELLISRGAQVDEVVCTIMLLYACYFDFSLLYIICLYFVHMIMHYDYKYYMTTKLIVVSIFTERLDIIKIIVFIKIVACQ